MNTSLDKANRLLERLQATINQLASSDLGQLLIAASGPLVAPAEFLATGASRSKAPGLCSWWVDAWALPISLRVSPTRSTRV